ncbi:hypothetical protein SUDANB1_03376 [Streptomyces sp. enrichment culture]|uniref:hypothetical protein n=1 Tax=Streptomyces sp. enrichment culture TaxID=1795815 RepID=UPI003F574551
MFSPASRYGIAGATLALWALTACGSSSGGGDDPTTAPTTTRAAVKDKGPQCVGEAPADGVHVLRGGGFRLPGGGGVQYAAASADGTSRTATLRDGVGYGAGQRQWTVKPGSPLTVSGHAYTVRQVCSYRVVLEPQDAKDKAALAAAPESMEFAGGAADNPLCFTTNRAVGAATARSFPGEGQTLSLLANGGVKQLPTGLSLTVSYIDTAAGTAGLGANCAGIPVAQYKDVRADDTVEFAGVQFKVSGLTEQAVRLTRTSE